jgi:hypothetical protein
MAKFFDNKVLPDPPSQANPKRYEILSLKDVEPNLGTPSEDGNFLSSSRSGDRVWTPVTIPPYADFILKSTIQNKGDVLVGRVVRHPSALGVGLDGQVLFVNLGEPLGLEWKTIPPFLVPISRTPPSGNPAEGQLWIQPPSLTVPNSILWVYVNQNWRGTELVLIYSNS